MFRKKRHVFVYNKTRETFLAFRVAVADSVWGRLRGLLGKRSLAPDSGVWIVPASAVHTIGMLFSFDMVLIDKDFKVVGLRELVRPFTVTWPNHRAESVLELPAHSIFRSRTQVGDQLLIERYEAKKPPKSGPTDEAAVLSGSDHAPVLDPVLTESAPIAFPPQSSKLDSQRTGYVDTKIR